MGVGLDTSKYGPGDDNFASWPPGIVNSGSVPAIVPKQRHMTVAEARAMPSVHHWLKLGSKVNPAWVWFSELWERPYAYSREDIARGHKVTHEVKVRAQWPDGGVFEYEGYFVSLEGAMWGLEGAMKALSRGTLKRKTGRTIQAYAGPVREGP